MSLPWPDNVLGWLHPRPIDRAKSINAVERAKSPVKPVQHQECNYRSWHGDHHTHQRGRRTAAPESSRTELEPLTVQWADACIPDGIEQ